jgi:hypothetical protein
MKRSIFGFGLGTVVAFALSWARNHSLLWAIVHAVYSWFYVAYVGLIEAGILAPIDSSAFPPALAAIIAGLLFVIAAAIVGTLLKR